MAAKTPKPVQPGQIELKQTQSGITQFFDADHAERILNYDVRIGRTNWELTDAKLTFQDGKINGGGSDNAN